ncbi:hypothetical protein CRG98_031247 [Punica granatum]|uniref:Uncharacterized protein n=1 Tax=Punica granatum TaxID=22663 RepID=A0A2I0IWN6_PUNGR|nr:hypothetical protein CRG98_031247 [Punica granatum]
MGLVMGWAFIKARTIRADLITLGANDYYGYLEGSLGYPGLLTLPQNSIGSLRVRFDPT